MGIEVGTFSKNFTSDTPALPKVRIDHNTFQDDTDMLGYGIWNHSTMVGVVDNNTFTVVNPVKDDSGTTAAQARNWYAYLYPHWDTGTADYLYYEDNTFTGEGDSSGSTTAEAEYGGSRYVFRYNTISSSHNGEPQFDMHGYDSSVGMYASFGCEIYGNNITTPSAGILASMRGGKSMVFFNNASASGYTAFNAYSDDCPTDYITQQTQHDSYFWGNRSTYTGGLMDSGVDHTASCSPTVPVSGVNFFGNDTSHGVTCGTLANRPTSCTTGQGYWATNQSCTDLTGMVGKNPSTPISGTLYKCTATDTWTSFYTPYTYPHPLRTEASSQTTYALTVTSANGTVTSTLSGINCGSTCSANYDQGSSVILTASPNSGYTFTGWSGGGCSGTGTCTVTMNAATSVTASFAMTAYNLTVTKSGTGSGTVSGSDGLINCGSTCSVNYASVKSVTLTASATSGSTFSGWSGACSGKGTCTVTMTAATTVAATFTPIYNLTVTNSVTAAGTVTCSDGPINCGSTCSANYNPGTSVTLTVSAASGYTFTGWSGGGCSGTGTCTVTMNAATSVTATFATTAYNITVTKSGTGSGTVTGSDGLINCGSTCSVNYESGTSVTLAASVNSGSYFSGWSGGGCSGTGTCTVVGMTVATSVRATFDTSVSVYKLTVRKSGTGSGTVTSSPSGISCGTTCSANYTYGKVTLAASANSGATFSGWSGACSGTGTCTVTMTAAKSVTATFTKSFSYSKKRR